MDPLTALLSVDGTSPVLAHAHTRAYTACRGAIRRIPPSVVDLVKNANRSLKLGQLLCACRSPDFLLEIVQHQVGGARQYHTHYWAIVLLAMLKCTFGWSGCLPVNGMAVGAGGVQRGFIGSTSCSMFV